MVAGAIIRTLVIHPIDLVLRPFPGISRRWETTKASFKHYRKLAYFRDDFARSCRLMIWQVDDDSYGKLSAQLLFQYHKLEKGLCLADGRRFFGKDAALSTMGLVGRWRRGGHPREDRVYAGAIETLRSYRLALGALGVADAGGDVILHDIDTLLATEPRVADLDTPRPYQKSADTAAMFDRLCHERRSVRAYKPEPVEQTMLERAIAMAQLSPSVCNRQAWHVHIYREPEQLKRLLHLQNGNGGFGHQLTTLLIITMSSTAFFDASERNQQFVDAGLFSMSLLLALQAIGLASCCLNWCVSPHHEDEAHRRGNIPADQRIMMYLAVGHGAEDAMVPRSPRRDLVRIVTTH